MMLYTEVNILSRLKAINYKKLVVFLLFIMEGVEFI